MKPTTAAVVTSTSGHGPRPALRYPLVAYDSLPWLTREDMVEIDRVMMHDLGIDLVRMMENAGRNLAQLAIDRFAPKTVTVLAGTGGNGGGGLVAARHLANRGVDVSVTLTKPADQLAGVPAEQAAMLARIDVPFTDTPRAGDLVLDAVLGYSLDGAPRGRAAELIAAAPELAPAALSLDTPSGLDVTTGSTPGVVVTATATLTLAAPKIGLREAAPVGELYVGDISVPPAVYQAMGLTPMTFTTDPILRLKPRRASS